MIHLETPMWSEQAGTQLTLEDRNISELHAPMATDTHIGTYAKQNFDKGGSVEVTDPE